MPQLVEDVQTFISQRLHNLLFLEEFVFARNKFTPPASSELELADAVVMIGDVLIIYQIKERRLDRRIDFDAERNWFNAKVLAKATKQIRDTLRYLEAYPEIWVPNERGHRFNLAARSFTDIIKIVVYAPAPHLPGECRSIRHHISESGGGFIHVIDAHDYLELSRTLRVPREIVDYFKFRERLLTRFPDACAGLPEAAIASHYIVADADSTTAPTDQSAARLRHLLQDAEEWDLAPVLRSLHKNLSADPTTTEYYDILLEFMKLPRSGWRSIKERIDLTIQKVKKDEFARPYRMVEIETGCGFIFVPTTSDLVMQPDWREGCFRFLRNMTTLHKYDQRLSKCVGYLMGKDGDYFDVAWCLLHYDWVEDPDLQKILDEGSPLRPVREGVVYSYFLRND